MYNDLQHRKFKYKLGLNIDHHEFTPNNEFSKGGLHFYEESKCRMYWAGYDTKLALIEIPGDARVFVKRDEFKVDRLVITDIMDFDNVPDSFWIGLIKSQSHCGGSALALKYVKNQTDEICKFAIEQHYYVLAHIKNQTDEICKLVVRRDGFMLKHVKNQTDEICKLAVRQYGPALQYVKNQTEEICKLAVECIGIALEHVKNQTDEICKLAVQNTGLALQYVKNPTEEIRRMAIEQNWRAIEFIKHEHQTDEIIKSAVQQSWMAIRHVTQNRSDDVLRLIDQTLEKRETTKKIDKQKAD